MFAGLPFFVKTWMFQKDQSKPILASKTCPAEIFWKDCFHTHMCIASKQYLSFCCGSIERLYRDFPSRSYIAMLIF